MKLALGGVVASTILFVGSGLGIFGSWGLPVSAVALLFAAVVAAVAMEARDLDAVEGLVVHGEPSLADADLDADLLEAA